MWTKDVLKRMSCHYKDQSTLPDKLIDDIIKAKNAGVGLGKREIFSKNFEKIY
jgi:thimet oligopeptidase